MEEDILEWSDVRITELFVLFLILFMKVTQFLNKNLRHLQHWVCTSGHASAKRALFVGGTRIPNQPLGEAN